MKSVRSDMPVGFNLAMTADQPAPEDSHLAEKRADVYGPWLEVAKQCDYLGVQMYSRSIVGKKDLPPPKGAELTQVGWEFYPECVEKVVRYASKETGVPIMVTENGVATTDDRRRVEYFQRALAGLKHAIDDGVDVRGYVAWSLLDNFEWMSGFEPKFGIVAVDRATQTENHQTQRSNAGKYRAHKFPVIWSSVFLAANDKFSDGSENVYMNRRYCLTLDLKNDPALIAEYKRYHQNIWPEITKSIKDSGIESHGDLSPGYAHVHDHGSERALLLCDQS